MKKLTLFLLSACFSGSLLATNANEKECKTNKTSEIAISGQVTDQKTHEVLTGVKITIRETGESTYTDFDGNYNFQLLRPGKYHIQASYISYNQKEQAITIEANKKNKSDLNLSTAQE